MLLTRSFPFSRMVRIAPQLVVRPMPHAESRPRVLAEFSTEPVPGEVFEGRWTRLRITQVEPDQFLCEKTRGPEPIEHRQATVGNLESAKAFFGGGWVVKELFFVLDPVRFPRWDR
jgi:hypothetical protein